MSVHNVYVFLLVNIMSDTVLQAYSASALSWFFVLTGHDWCKFPLKQFMQIKCFVVVEVILVMVHGENKWKHI